MLTAAIDIIMHSIRQLARSLMPIKVHLTCAVKQNSKEIAPVLFYKYHGHASFQNYAVRFYIILILKKSILLLFNLTI
jgi:hypothetical protein